MNSKEARSKGFRQFAIGMFFYAASVITSGLLVNPEAMPTVYGVILALLPMVAAVWGMAGWLRAVRTFDELQQKMFADAGLISLGLTALATFSYAFLQAMVNLPQLSMFVVFPFIALSFGIALHFMKRRYV